MIKFLEWISRTLESDEATQAVVRRIAKITAAVIIAELILLGASILIAMAHL